MNSVQLLGRLGKDAELKVLANGSSLLKFSIATSEKWKDATTGEPREKTEWHNCTYWTKGAAKLAPYLTKGSQLGVQGSISYSKSESDGVTKFFTDIKVSNIHFVGSKNGGQAQAQDQSDNDDDDGLPALPPAGVGSDEIPF